MHLIVLKRFDNSRSKAFLSFLLLLGSSLSISPAISFPLNTTGNIISLAASVVFLVVVLRLQIGVVRTGIILLSLVSAFFFIALSGHVALPIKELLIALLAYSGFKSITDGGYLYSIQNSVKILINDLIVTAANIKINAKVITFALVSVFLSLLSSFYWENITGRILIYFILALLVASYVSKQLMIRYIELASRFHYWMLALAVPGFLYAYFGGDPIFTITNEDGRENGFCLSTFSNTYLLGFIRPSGIYDEPGALSFFLCMIVSLREAFCLDRKVSWRLLLLGFITTSLAHFVFVVLYAIHAGIFRIKNALRLVFMVLAIVGIVYFTDSPLSSLVISLFSRFEIIDGTIAGDNRTALLVNAISYLNLTVAIFGLNGACILNSPECIPGQYEQYGENPLTLMVHLGLSLSWPYYLALLYLLIKAVGVNRYLILGVLFLLLQRPNLLSYGYSIIIVLFIYSLYKYKLETRRGAFCG